MTPTLADKIEDGDGPLWKASYYYVPAGPNQRSKSYQMFWKQIDTEAYAASMRADAERYSDVEISFPHYAGENNNDPGWTRVEDLNEAERAELERLISGKDAH